MPPFEDVAGHWAEPAIGWAVSSGLFNGVSQTRFAPDAPMTRGMFVTVLHRLAGAPETAPLPFADIAEDDYCRQAAGWAVGAGIAEGVGEGRFDPQADISREQVVALLFRYAQYAGRTTWAEADVPEPFADRPALSDWALPAMRWAVTTGLVNGRDGGLAPKAPVTRAEASALLMRFVVPAGPGGQ